MKVRVDANLSPALAPWMNQELRCEASSAQLLGLLTATDNEIFEKAREEDAVILTKDGDFIDLVNRHGPPPKVVWLSCGNTTNARLRQIMTTQWVRVDQLLREGHPVVELTDSISD
jgi:predicted nuclease of predicted toxin-antitoxin system